MRKASDTAKINLSERSESDQITSLNVLRNRDVIAKRGHGALAGWCRQNLINSSSLNMISDLRNVVSRELEGLGFSPCFQNGYHNRSGDFNPAFLQASICAGLYVSGVHYLLSCLYFWLFVVHLNIFSILQYGHRTTSSCRYDNKIHASSKSLTWPFGVQAKSISPRSQTERQRYTSEVSMQSSHNH